MPRRPKFSPKQIAAFMTPGTGQESYDLNSMFDLIERGRQAQAAANDIDR